MSIFDDGCHEEVSLLFQFDAGAAPGEKDVVLHMFFGRTMIEVCTQRPSVAASQRPRHSFGWFLGFRFPEWRRLVACCSQVVAVDTRGRQQKCEIVFQKQYQ